MAPQKTKPPKSNNGNSPKKPDEPSKVQLEQIVLQLQENYANLTKKFEDLTNNSFEVKDQFHMELDYMKTIIMNQNTKISNLQRELDDLNQYNRRENVMFSNILVPANADTRQVVVDICHEIGVDIETTDMVDAHPLPGKRGRPSKVIARFKERSKAREIFKNRKKCKDLTKNLKKRVCSNSDKSVGINPNLTFSKGKLLHQVKEFNDKYSYHGAWADYNTGKIYLKTKPQDRGYVITDTSDLISINSDFNPGVSDYIFCTPPLFYSYAEKGGDVEEGGHESDQY